MFLIIFNKMLCIYTKLIGLIGKVRYLGDSQNMKPISAVLGYSPEVDGKFLLLKTP